MVRKEGQTLVSLDAWERLAGPKSSIQWQDYRSAKECARAWLDRGDALQIPAALLRVLATHPDLGTVLDWGAEPECQVPFDEYDGPANVDVLVTCRDDRGGFVMAVEAKADESFGPLVDRALSDALERRLASASSKGVARIEGLARHLLGVRAKGQPPLHQIRYQLLTASAAALSHAKRVGATRAVVMVHEFRTPRTKEESLSRNGRDLVRYLTRLGVGDAERVLREELVGPIRVQGGDRYQDPVPLYVGKASQIVRTRDLEAQPG